MNWDKELTKYLTQRYQGQSVSYLQQNDNENNFKI